MYNVVKLNNGLKIALEEIDYVNSVSVGLWVKNGSRNENRQNNGISHFIEHMLFKGTYNRNSKEIAECIEDVGGQINAFTGKEATCYYVKILDSHLELALDVLSDMLFNSKFSDEDIEKEKGVIIEEINMSEDSPEDVLMDVHSKAIWGEESIALPILGTEDTITSFDRQHIIDYVYSHYIPENCVLSIAGKFSIDKIVNLIEKYFGNWHITHKEITNYTKPQILDNHLFKKKSIEQLHMSLGLYGVELGSEDVYSLLLLNNILGGGASSILFQKIREEKGRCYSIYSYLSSFNNTGVVSIYTGLNSKYAIEVIQLIQDELIKFSKSNISYERILKGKEQLKGNYILGLESTSSRMFSNGRSVLFLNRINKPEDTIKKIDNINEEKIKKAMDNTFKKGIINSAYVGEQIDLNLVKILMEKHTVPFNNSKTTLI
ncbi:M16 family metallopeptidase [Clostridium tetanomorphum]|uniref:Insulinase family protein n=1 Tax=Clostridium tetanomorphum TaxID=1553 RepID=A0A923EDV6_CLOTT|nr:pitrilysin family protein [Clostridium tetanomorphum]MBC2398928.1 insulinase family protein [Clostridium tetanomorphum]NRZ97853.1 putative Zn-dependent peptidase [Clostridium tetanomorphum]